MAHGIFVCLEHKRLMHGARNIGIHSKKHHGKDYTVLEAEGVIVEIGQCEPTLWNPCKDPHDRPTTNQEVELAQSLKDEQVRKIKERKERWARGDYT